MKANLRPIKDQCVVLFGATSGIGLETAMHLVEKGAKVAIVGRSQEGLNEALARVRDHAESSRMLRERSTNGKHISPYGTLSGVSSVPGAAEMGADVSATGPVAQTSTTLDEQVIALEADVTVWEQVRSVAEQVIRSFGRIDTWVNVAAVSEWALFEDTSPEEFKRIIDVNLVGHAYGAMAALPYMKQEQGGSLIFVSSVAGKIPIPYQSAYNASKHGIIGLAETLRLEARHTGLPINVTAILPASMNTPLFNKARTKIGVEPEPIPPVYDGRLVAKAIAYAATHPVRELVVGDSGYVMTFMRRLAPTLTSNYMGMTGFRQQRSNEPKSAQAPDNLFEHVSGFNQVEGEYAPVAKTFSPMTYLSTHPKARLGVMAGLISGLGFWLGSSIIRARAMRRRRFSYRMKHFSKDALAFLAALPLLSHLPVFHKRSFFQRVGDRLPINGKARAIKSHLPMKAQREKLAGSLPTRKDLARAADKLPSRKHLARAVEKLPMVEHHESVLEKIHLRK